MEPTKPTKQPPISAPEDRTLFWEDEGGGKVRCTLCPHYCVVGESEEGLCRARGVRNGRMTSLTHSRPATIISDEIEKKPLFHFYPGTRALSLGGLGCNVLCSGCQNWQISHANARTETTRLPVLSPVDAVAMARKHKLAGVVFTYNDPVVWIEYVHDVCAAFREAGLYTAFITAAYLTEAALDYVAPVVQAFKFDLKAATAEGWAWLTKVKDPAPACSAAVRASKVHGCHVEVVSNIVPGLNDSPNELTSMARWVCENLGPATPWHVTRFLPDFELSYVSATPISVLEQGLSLGRAAGLRFVYLGNVPDHAGRNTFCPGCGRTVIDRSGPKVDMRGVDRGLCVVCGEDLGIAGAHHPAGDELRAV
jgi:pyruvate formate lyase activating enzyme